MKYGTSHVQDNQEPIQAQLMCRSVCLKASDRTVAYLQVPSAECSGSLRLGELRPS